MMKFRGSFGVVFFLVFYLCCILFTSISCSRDKYDITPDQKYTLTLEVDPSYGGTVDGEGEYDEGEEITVTAVTNEDYWFVNWTDNNSNVVSENTEHVFTMPAEDVALTANFSEIKDYEIHFIDVGQGDAIFITTGEKNLLVDAGWNNSIAVDYLNDLGVDKIDIVIATHPHADHIGGFLEVFYAFDVGEVIDPGVTHTSSTYSQYLYAIDVNYITYTEGRKGMTRDLGYQASLEILYPPEPVPSYDRNQLNNSSIVAKVTLGEVTVLLTGDIEREAENNILSQSVDLESKILKVSHHGSNSSSTWNFLRAVEPEVSVIMCGENNSYGHPHQPVLDRLNAMETEIYRTDIHGTIIIKTDRVSYQVITTEKYYSMKQMESVD